MTTRISGIVLETSGRTLLKLPQVAARTSKSRSTIYREIALGTFPSPVKLGGSSAWVSTEIDQYIEDCIAARDAKAVA